MYIENWDNIPCGAKVVQDTYNEIYEIVVVDRKRKLKQVGWQVPTNRDIAEDFVELDFEPNCSYDQPWIRIE